MDAAASSPAPIAANAQPVVIFTGLVAHMVHDEGRVVVNTWYVADKTPQGALAQLVKFMGDARCTVHMSTTGQPLMSAGNRREEMSPYDYGRWAVMINRRSRWLAQEIEGGCAIDPEIAARARADEEHVGVTEIF